jgi:hypothetical protein
MDRHNDNLPVARVGAAGGLVFSFLEECFSLKKGFCLAPATAAFTHITTAISASLTAPSFRLAAADAAAANSPEPWSHVLPSEQHLLLNSAGASWSSATTAFAGAVAASAALLSPRKHLAYLARSIVLQTLLLVQCLLEITPDCNTARGLPHRSHRHGCIHHQVQAISSRGCEQYFAAATVQILLPVLKPRRGAVLTVIE